MNKTLFVGYSGWAEFFILFLGVLLLGGCEPKVANTFGQEDPVIEEWSGDRYTVSIGREVKNFDLSKIDDQMRLEKFKEKHREAFEVHEQQMALKAQQEEEMRRQNQQIQMEMQQVGEQEGVVRSYP